MVERCAPVLNPPAGVGPAFDPAEYPVLLFKRQLVRAAEGPRVHDGFPNVGVPTFDLFDVAGANLLGPGNLLGRAAESGERFGEHPLSVGPAQKPGQRARLSCGAARQHRHYER